MRSALRPIEVLRPRTRKEALALLAEAAHAGTPLVPLAGGTDLFVVLNAGHGAPPAAARYLDLWSLDELRGVEVQKRGGDKRLVFGALATYTDCLRARAVHKHLPILALAAREVGGVQIQNRGTLAGNVGNGSPAGDSLPVLMAADARVILESAKEGEREVPLAAYYVGYRQSVRRPDELIVRIEVPLPDKHAPQRFRKVGTRAAQAISKVVLARVDGNWAFGSVGPTVLRARAVERYLASGHTDVAEARRLLAEDIHPIDDVRSTADYRLRVAQNLLAEALESEQ